MTVRMSPPIIGARVTFAEGTPQYAANEGIVYVVTSGAFEDNTHPEDLGRTYVWLEVEADAHLPKLRRRGRSGYVASLRIAPPTQTGPKS